MARADFGDEHLDEAFYSAADGFDFGTLDYDELDFGFDDIVDAFTKGFIDSDIDADDRADAREEFFEYMDLLGYEYEDFDWEAWREWYESA